MSPLIRVTADNVDEHGFFCCMSKRASVGWKAKRAWLEERFAEGLSIYLLPEGQRGFVESAPGEVAWKPVDAPGWTVIHCLWVVGKSQKGGGGRQLLEQVLADARADGRHGVAVVASRDNFCTDSRFYAHLGFEVVDEAPPRFQLMVHAFGEAPPPRFTDAARSGGCPDLPGLQVQTTDQCPYHHQLVEGLRTVADERGLDFTATTLRSADEVRQRACSGHGTWAVASEGDPLPNVFLPRSLHKVLDRKG